MKKPLPFPNSEKIGSCGYNVRENRTVGVGWDLNIKGGK